MVEVYTPHLLQLLEIGWLQSCYFLELFGEVSGTAVVHSMRNFADVEFIVKKQLFHFLNFRYDDKLLDRHSKGFGENIGRVVVVVP